MIAMNSLTKIAILIFSLLALIALPGFTQDFEARTIQDEYGYISVQFRNNESNGIPAMSADITDIQFEIRWPQSYGEAVDVALACSDYKLVEGLGGAQASGGHHWRVFAADSVPFHPVHDWVPGQWETIGKFNVTSPDAGAGYFAPSPDDWVVQGLNFGLDGVDYVVTVHDSVTGYPYPTKTWDCVWKGGAAPSGGFDQHSWTFGSNWTNVCGAGYEADFTPSAGHNCLIPGSLVYYPTNFNNYTAGTCFNLKILDGANLEVPAGVTLTVTGRADIYTGSQVTVKSGGSLRIQVPE